MSNHTQITSGHIRLICGLVFTQDFWMETMAGTWQWSARSKGTSRFWFWDHSSHNSNRIPFHTSCASTLSRPVSSLHQIQCFQLLSSVAWGWVDIQWLGGHYYLVPTCLNCYLPLAWPYTDTLPVVGSIYVESVRYIGPLIITLKVCKILDTRF